jgi:hypothetical protein
MDERTSNSLVWQWSMKFYRRASIMIMILCAVLFNVRALPAELTADQVRNKIASGVRFLKHEQNSDGSWDIAGSYANFGGGKTALCTLALLHAGVDPADPAIKKALNELAQLNKRDHFTYSVSLQIMVFCMVDSEKYRPQIAELVRWLEKAQVKSGERVGGWPYTLGENRDQIDNSNSQYALLALHEATKVGVKVDAQVWGRALDYWKREQDPRSGAFGYIGSKQNVSATMVCAGISSLIIAQENFQATNSRITGDKVSCCGEDEGDLVDAQIQSAMDWLTNRFSVANVPGPTNTLGSSYLFYYLYGLERAGRLAGVRFFGDHDWYREGAEHLVASQSLKGSWKGRSVESDEAIATSFAILFLAKGRRPIVIGKYKFGETNDWNRHRKGVHFLTRAVERSWKQELNWQDVNGNRADVNDLLESPVLFLSGKEAFTLEQFQKDALRDYINQGGFIFAEACNGDGCDGSAFDRSFRALLEELFPNSPLQPLSPEHAVWFADKSLEPSEEWPLLGLQACCRTSVIYCPRNLSCYWELDPLRLHAAVSEKVSANIDYTVRLGVNVLAYATNRDLKEKLDRRKVDTGAEIFNQRETITIAKVTHNGGADDAPVALANLLQAARSETGQPFVQRDELVSLSDEAIKSNPFLFIHGRQSWSLSEAEQKSLRKSILERRYFLFGDAICGSDEFAKSFREQMKIIFPDHPLKLLPADHPLLTDQYGGYPIDQVTLRESVRDEASGRFKVRESRIAPKLEVIEIDDRIAVVFSAQDLSCALENSGTSDCKGYTTEDATRLGINILLYALQN